MPIGASLRSAPLGTGGEDTLWGASLRSALAEKWQSPGPRPKCSFSKCLRRPLFRSVWDTVWAPPPKVERNFFRDKLKSARSLRIHQNFQSSSILDPLRDPFENIKELVGEKKGGGSRNFLKAPWNFLIAKMKRSASKTPELTGLGRSRCLPEFFGIIFRFFWGRDI